MRLREGTGLDAFSVQRLVGGVILVIFRLLESWITTLVFGVLMGVVGFGWVSVSPPNSGEEGAYSGTWVTVTGGKGEGG